MKKVLLLLTLTTISFVWAQEVFPPYEGEDGFDDYIGQVNDDNTTNSSAEEIIISEPIIVGIIADSENSETQSETNLTSSAEVVYSNSAKKINIPLWYRWKYLSINAMVPYIISKTATASTDYGSTYKDFTTNGIGDISVGASYGKYFDQYNTYVDANLTAKLPSGDTKAKDDTVIIPLGTGSLDIIGTISGYYFMDDFTFKSNFSYSYNGEGEYPDMSSFNGEMIKYEIGDDLLFTVGADYRWNYNLTFGLVATYGMHFESDDDDVNTPEYTDKTAFIDIKPIVKYPISLFEFVLGGKIPVYTDVPDYDTNDGTRNFSVFFRTNYRIF